MEGTIYILLIEPIHDVNAIKRFCIPGHLVVKNVIQCFVDQFSRSQDHDCFMEILPFCSHAAWMDFQNAKIDGWKIKIGEEESLILEGDDITFGGVGFEIGDTAYITCIFSRTRKYKLVVEEIQTITENYETLYNTITQMKTEFEEQSPNDQETDSENEMPSPKLTCKSKPKLKFVDTDYSETTPSIPQIHVHTPPTHIQEDFNNYCTPNPNINVSDLEESIFPNFTCFPSPKRKRNHNMHTSCGVYISGGLGENGQIFEDVLRFTPSIDRAWHKIYAPRLNGNVSPPPGLQMTSHNSVSTFGCVGHSICFHIDSQGNNASIYLVGGREDFSIDRFDLRTSLWEKNAIQIPPEYDWYGVEVRSVIIEQKMYIIGPNWTNSSLKKLYNYKSQKNFRNNHTTTQQTESQTLDSPSFFEYPTKYRQREGKLGLFCYDFVTHIWEELPSVPTTRYLPEVIVADRKIYVLGGCDTGKRTIWGSSSSSIMPQSLDVVEMYNPETKIWTMLSPMCFSRSSFGASFWNGFIYVTGGESSQRVTLANTDENIQGQGQGHGEDKNAQKGKVTRLVNEMLESCERYNVQKDSWEWCGELKSGPRAGHKMLNFMGKIYVIGGIGIVEDNNGFHRYCEVMNPSEDESEWEITMPLRRTRVEFGAVSIEILNEENDVEKKEKGEKKFLQARKQGTLPQVSQV